MTEDRPLKVVKEKDRCPFTRMVGGNKFVCTKPPHREEYGHNMVSEKEAIKHGFI